MDTLRIACWSGPRNISTALMRSWSSRPDTTVSDEPLYAHYLSTLAQADCEAHPGWDEVMRSQPSEWSAVVAQLTGPVPERKPVWYQKHMAHHLTDAMDRDWLAGFRHVLLVREPSEMLTSFIKVIPNPTPADLGLPQQVQLAHEITQRTGTPPLVIDSREILQDPRAGLTKMCHAVGLEFDEAMLAWPRGPHPADGVWAPHWYASVEQSTGFGPYRRKNEPVPDHLADVLAECQHFYEQLLPRQPRES